MVQPNRPGGASCKNLPANAENARDASLIPGSGRSPGGRNEMATLSSILAWKVSWREEPGGLQSMRLGRIRCDWEHSLTD